MTTRVLRVALRPIVDSRGASTVEALVEAEGGHAGRAGAPSGASTGTHEVQAWPEGGVPAALERFRSRVEPQLRGRDLEDSPGWDQALHDVDGTPEFRAIGGNVATALSVAASIARADASGVPLWSLWARPGVHGRTFPAIVGNCLNGGRHAIGGPEFQEFHAYATSPDPADSIRAALAVHRAVGEILTKRFPGKPLGRGDEGGWVAAVSNTEGLGILSEACTRIRDELHLPVDPGLDLAASEFYRDGKYHYRDRALGPEEQVAFLASLVDRFGIRYLEDPLEQEAFSSFAELTRAVGGRTQIVGDDLYTTHIARLERGIVERATNAVLVKVNQAGTLTDTWRVVDRAREAGLATVASHRSGDLPEGWLAHLAVAAEATGLKCGLLGGERVAKLNELLRVAAAAGASS